MLLTYIQNIAFKESKDKATSSLGVIFALRDIFSVIITTNNKNLINKIGKRKKDIYDKNGKRKKQHCYQKHTS